MILLLFLGSVWIWSVNLHVFVCLVVVYGLLCWVLDCSLNWCRFVLCGLFRVGDWFLV